MDDETRVKGPKTGSEGDSTVSQLKGDCLGRYTYWAIAPDYRLVGRTQHLPV
jgi:hypothetical protein